MKHLVFLFYLFFTSLASAENATALLDKAAEKFKAAGDVKIGFQVNTESGSTTGYIDIAGNKFHCDLGGTRVWYDGADMWHLVKSNNEVNVTTPTATEAAKLNPYSFISMYKKGYTCKMGKSTAKYHELILTGKQGSAYKTVLVQFDKKTYQPLYIKTVTPKHTTEFTVNSYLTNQHFPAGAFKFDKKEFPKAEIVDLR
jgi:outer membrane lipoprotein-sorting protein